MEVLVVVFSLALLVGLLCIVGVVAFHALIWGLMFWPAILGIALGIWLWVAGYDNAGAIIGLAGIIGQIVYFKTINKSQSTPYSGPSGRAYRDPEGNIKGYIDRE